MEITITEGYITVKKSSMTTLTEMVEIAKTLIALKDVYPDYIVTFIDEYVWMPFINVGPGWSLMTSQIIYSNTTEHINIVTCLS